MHIKWLEVAGFRAFHKCRVDFVSPEADFACLDLPPPKMANVNLLLGNNGMGKTTLLQAVALAALGPAVADAGLFPYRWVRRQGDGEFAHAQISAEFDLQTFDGGKGSVRSKVRVRRKEHLEQLRWNGGDEEPWTAIFRQDSPAFFVVGYGANRRSERLERFDLGARQSTKFARALRVMGLFDESFSLVPLSAWLPKLSPGSHRQKEVLALVQRLLPDDGVCRLTSERVDGEYVFDWEGTRVPFPAMSDGYRAFIAWVSDLLFHLHQTCPEDLPLNGLPGMVLLDEVDLHLHPEWQQKVLPVLSQTFPRLQFLVTSHSPLVVGSVESSNLLVLTSRQGGSVVERHRVAIGSMDADQILWTDYFGLNSTRNAETARRLKELSLSARQGDAEAALQLLGLMSGKPD